MHGDRTTGPSSVQQLSPGATVSIRSQENDGGSVPGAVDDVGSKCAGPQLRRLSERRWGDSTPLFTPVVGVGPVSPPNAPSVSKGSADTDLRLRRPSTARRVPPEDHFTLDRMLRIL